MYRRPAPDPTILGSGASSSMASSRRTCSKGVRFRSRELAQVTMPDRGDVTAKAGVQAGVTYLRLDRRPISAPQLITTPSVCAAF